MINNGIYLINELLIETDLKNDWCGFDDYRLHTSHLFKVFYLVQVTAVRFVNNLVTYILFALLLEMNTKAIPSKTTNNPSANRL